MDDSTPYKVFTYNEPGAEAEVRRFSLDKVKYGKIKCLQARLHDVYPKLKSKKYTLAWRDEDGDEILISTDDELQTMLTESNDAVFKLYVRCTGSKQDEELAAAAICNTASGRSDRAGSLHAGILCDACGNAVVGYRYKCIICDEFDLCVRCEHDGKHPEHCVVRVPVPNMPLPLIKASIKKSRRFLKSVASQAHEESKRLRRERSNTSRKYHGSTNEGSTANQSQPCLSRNWVEIFGTYLEEFTNLAGDFSRQVNKDAEPAKAAEPEQAKAATAKAGPSISPNRSVPNDEEIFNNPWNLPKEDLEKLQHACRYMRDNAVQASLKPLTKAFNKVLEIATTVAEEATAQSPARAFCPIREASVLKTNGENPEIQREMQMQEADKLVEPEVAKPTQSPQMETSQATSGQQTPAPDSKAPALTKEDIKETAKLANDMPKGIFINGCNISELMSAVSAARSEMSSNASSCSSEGQGSERAEGWTVIEDQTPKDSGNPELLPSELAEILRDRVRYCAPYSSIYPTLQTSAAVLEPNQGMATAAASAAASAPPIIEAPKPQPQPSTSKAALAAQQQILRSKLAPHIEASIRQMEAMGFSNESGWLTQLLENNDGNIATVLDLITPVAPKKK